MTPYVNPDILRFLMIVIPLAAFLAGVWCYLTVKERLIEIEQRTEVLSQHAITLVKMIDAHADNDLAVAKRLHQLSSKQDSLHEAL